MLSRAQDNSGTLKHHMTNPTCCCTGAESGAREAHLESKERALVMKQHELVRRQGILKSIEKALHDRERMIQAREATLEAKIRWWAFSTISLFSYYISTDELIFIASCFRFNGRSSLSPGLVLDTRLHSPTPPLKLRAKSPRKEA